MIKMIQSTKIKQVTTGILALFMTASSGFSYAVPVYAEEATAVAAKRKKEEQLGSTESSTLQLNENPTTEVKKKDNTESTAESDGIKVSAGANAVNKPEIKVEKKNNKEPGRELSSKEAQKELKKIIQSKKYSYKDILQRILEIDDFTFYSDLKLDEIKFLMSGTIEEKYEIAEILMYKSVYRYADYEIAAEDFYSGLFQYFQFLDECNVKLGEKEIEKIEKQVLSDINKYYVGDKKNYLKSLNEYLNRIVEIKKEERQKICKEYIKAMHTYIFADKKDRDKNEIRNAFRLKNETKSQKEVIKEQLIESNKNFSITQGSTLKNYQTSSTENNVGFNKGAYFYLAIKDEGGKTSTAKISINGKSDKYGQKDKDLYYRLRDVATTWSCSLSSDSNNHNIKLNNDNGEVTTKLDGLNAEAKRYHGDDAGKTTTRDSYFIMCFSVSYTIHAHYQYSDYTQDMPDLHLRFNVRKYTRKLKDADGNYNGETTVNQNLVHKDTTDNINVQINTGLCGVRDYAEKRYLGPKYTIIFKKPTHKVTFKSGYGSGDGTTLSTKTVTDGDKMTLPANPTRTGYKFAGWSGDTTSIVCADRTIKATWTPWKHTIHYDANGGTGAPADQTKSYGTDLTLSSTKPTRTGYTFGGWSLTATGDAAYQAGGKYTKDQDGGTVTLYAVWTPWKNTIHYDAGGGTGAPADQTRIYGQDLTLSSTKPTRSGYTFQGWNMKKDGLGTSYQPGAKYGEKFGADGDTQTLYAQWAISDHTVAYNANGGTGAPASQTKKYGVTLTLSSTKPTRTGYTFKNWNTSQSGSSTGSIYNPGGSYTHDQNGGTVTLYAQWDPWKHTVAYNANGGTGAPASQTKTYGVNLTLSSTKPTRTGYTFGGWSLSANGTAAYQPGSTYTKEQNGGTVTLYAVWTPWKHTVAYNANGGTGAPASQTKTYGVNLTLSKTVPTRNGYTFGGWSLSSTSSVVAYQPGGIYSKEQNGGTVTLYAIWTPWKHTVAYDANGGTGAPASQTKTYGVNLTLSKTVPTRNGYVFIGWNTSKTGNGTDYASGGTYTHDQNGGTVTLYAKWTPWTHVVHYDGNATGVSNIPVNQTKTFGQILTLSVLVPVRKGYTFKGWNTRSGGNGTWYQPGGTYASDQNGGTVTLYAQWDPWKYTINYNKNVPSSSSSQTVTNMPSSQTKIQDQTLTLSSLRPSRNGYTFAGWNTKADGTGKAYQPGASYTENLDSNGASTTLYAIWTPWQHTVAYDANGGTGAPASQIKYFDQVLTLRTTIPTRKGYTFKSWNTKADGTGKTYQPGGSYTDDQNGGTVTLYAVWTPWTHTVHYDKNVAAKDPQVSQNVANIPADQKKTYGQSLTLSSNTPTRTGYTFNGWNTRSDGTGTAYKAGGSYNYDRDTDGGVVTLYAQWTPWKHTVHYDKNVKTTSSSQTVTNMPADQTKIFDETLTLSNLRPSRNGYTFKGWNTKADGTGTSYQPGSSYTYNRTSNGGTETLYAQWTPWKHTVHYDKNVKTTSSSQTVTNMPADQTKTFDETLTLSRLTPVRNGYTFTGWNTKSDGTGTSYQPGEVYDHDQNGGTSTLYAQWTPWKHTVHYDKNVADDSSSQTVTNMPADQTKTFDEKMTVSPLTPSRNGYIFEGWNTKADGTGTSYQPGEEYKHDQNGNTETLYAQWKAWKHTIHYDANSGDQNSVPADQTKIFDEKLNLSEKVPTKHGYNFVSWNTKADGTGTTYNPGAEYDHDQNGGVVILYAQWTPWKHTLHYDANGGDKDSVPEDQTKTFGEPMTISDKKPTRSEYKFIGWNTEKDGNGTSYQPGDDYDHDQNGETNTLYAQWVQLYTVVYDGNQPEFEGCVVTGSVESQTQGQDENVNLRYNNFKNNSGVYKDWSVGKDAYKFSKRNGKFREYIHPEQYETNHPTMREELKEYTGGKQSIEDTIVQN